MGNIIAVVAVLEIHMLKKAVTNIIDPMIVWSLAPATFKRVEKWVALKPAEPIYQSEKACRMSHVAVDCPVLDNEALKSPFPFHYTQGDSQV